MTKNIDTGMSGYYIPVDDSMSLSMKCRACEDRLEVKGEMCLKDIKFCPFCGVEYQ